MKVSVIVPAYQVEKYILRCLSSLVNQTLKDIEIIIVNDGSTDNTLYLCEQVAKQYSNITIISQENKGSIEARKIGLFAATGEYILFVDSDDWIDVNTLRILYDKAKLEDADITLYHAIITDGQMGYYFPTYKEESIKNNADYLEEFLKGNFEPAMWSKLFKRNFLINNSINFPQGLSFAEDRGRKIKCVNS